jgi:hypothetical protein
LRLLYVVLTHIAREYREVARVIGNPYESALCETDHQTRTHHATVVLDLRTWSRESDAAGDDSFWRGIKNHLIGSGCAADGCCEDCANHSIATQEQQQEDPKKKEVRDACFALLQVGNGLIIVGFTVGREYDASASLSPASCRTHRRLA